MFGMKKQNSERSDISSYLTMFYCSQKKKAAENTGCGFMSA